MLRLAALPLLACSLVHAATAPRAVAQVHYFPNGMPWSQRADRGPDASVPGWYYNLGITGIRVELIEEDPTALLVRYVFPGSPADGVVRVGDRIVGAGGRPFRTPHQNGYGMAVFGARGPIQDFAQALGECQREERKGVLALRVRRGDGSSGNGEPGDGQRGDDDEGEEAAGARPPLAQAETLDLEVKVGTRYGSFAPTFPASCPKSTRILQELCDFLIASQREDGSWGSPAQDTFAPLALLACGDAKYLPAVEKCARMHARTTKAVDSSSLINWRYMAAGIVLSEYYLATRAEWVLPELQEVYDFLISSQFVSASQIDEKTKEERPEDLPRGPLDSHGGWGHNPGFEGYGPISMLTGQGALVFALLRRCGVAVDRARHDAAYAFLARATGPNGYVWYEDAVAGPQDWADMGRTGAAGIANALSPYPEEIYRQRAHAHARVIGEHPQSFPDTHGSPIMGMGYAAVAAFTDASAFRELMDANRWWFTLAQCADGSYYYQPNRDNAGYGGDSRISATAVTAFIFSLPRRGLVMSGRRDGRRRESPPVKR